MATCNHFWKWAFQYFFSAILFLRWYFLFAYSVCNIWWIWKRMQRKLCTNWNMTAVPDNGVVISFTICSYFSGGKLLFQRKDIHSSKIASATNVTITWKTYFVWFSKHGWIHPGFHSWSMFEGKKWFLIVTEIDQGLFSLVGDDNNALTIVHFHNMRSLQHEITMWRTLPRAVMTTVKLVGWIPNHEGKKLKLNGRETNETARRRFEV